MHSSTAIIIAGLLITSVVSKAIPQNGGFEIPTGFETPPGNGNLQVSTFSDDNNRTILFNDDDTQTIPFPFDDTPENVLQLSKAFELIENIPDATLEASIGVVAIWTQAYDGSITGKSSQEDFSINPKKALKILKCVGEFAILLQKGSLTIEELKNIKSIISKLGGAKAVAKLLLNAKSWKQLGTLGGPLLKELGGYLQQWKTAIKDCFGFKI
jgi:hypothetical protein